MDHETIKDALYALHDGELSETQRGEVLAHLRSCAECAEAARRWESLSGALSRVFPRPTPRQTEAFVRAVMARLGPGEEPAAWRRLAEAWLLPVLSFATAVLLFAILGGAFDPVAATDDILLIGSSGRPVGQLVLPPDPARSDNTASFIAEAQ